MANDILRHKIKDYEYDEETGLYTPLDHTFVNTALYSEAAAHFKKHGCYTKLHPKYDKYEYREFWQEERRRRVEGYSVGGVRISGEHYGFLNYGPILRTVAPEQLEGTVKDPNNTVGIVDKRYTFPDFWDGHYKWFKLKEFARKNGKHIIGGKARRKGFSYVGGWMAADKIDLYPRRTVGLGAIDTKYLTKGDGLMTMAKNYLNHINTHTAWYKRRLVNTKEHVKIGYQKKGMQEERGFLSQLLAISFKNNPEAAIGKDLYELYLDELGKMENFKSMLDVTVPTLEDGSLITGQIIAWGTGGSDDDDWDEFAEIFYNPESYNFLSCNNIWDDASEGTPCGFFFPYIQNLVPFLDKEGNSQLEVSKTKSDELREKKKKATTDVQTYVNYCAQRANMPSEAFATGSTNIFYSEELRMHANKVNNDPIYKQQPRYGKLLYDEDNKLRLFTNDELANIYKMATHPPIWNFPLKPNDDVEGCYIEWIPIYKDATGRTPKNLYRLWHDPYAVSKNKDDITIKDSLGVTYVYERPNNITPTRGDLLIGAYVGRPADLNQYNEGLYRLCSYVGAYEEMLMYEADRGDVYSYFKHRKATHLLADEPEFLFNKELASKSHNRAKGVKVGTNSNRKSSGIMYLKEWLYTERSFDETTGVRYNFHTINDPALLNELLKWNLKGNFDRVSTLIVGMFDMKEEEHTTIQKAYNHKTTRTFLNRQLFG